MPSENTRLKNATPAGDSNTTDDMVILKSNTYRCPFLIVAGSLLALLVWFAVEGTTSVQHLHSSAHEITEGAVANADYQVDSANSAFTKDNFNRFKISEEENGNSNGKKSRELKQKKNKKSKNKKGDKTTITDISDLVSVSENEEGCDFAAEECPNIPGAKCVTPNGQGIPCASEGNCNKICCGSNGFDDCCMCKEYCDQYAVCSNEDADQFHTSGCCCCNGPKNITGTDCPRSLANDDGLGWGYCNCGVDGCPTQYLSF